jgi:hypothetical protein
MKKLRLLLLSAALPALCGCASFNSGDIKVERAAAMAMLTDASLIPFADLQVYWQNFPYRSPTDSIGEGSISNPKVITPVPVQPEEIADLSERAKDIFGKAGLYDPAKGRGTLRLTLTSLGRWTYSDLFRSFLVETGFIFILPATLQVNYLITADFEVPGGTVQVETAARNRTTFHLLMAPLYPFFSPGRRETGLINQMLWRSATDVYAKLKAAGGHQGTLPPPAQEKQERTIPGPPVNPDRTWLPGKEDGAPDVLPEAPDKTWVVPATDSKAPQYPDVKPAPSDRAWEVKPAPSANPAAQPAAAQRQAAPAAE